MISLIINPSFAMPGHQAMLSQPTVSSQHTASAPSTSHSTAHHKAQSQDMAHCDNCIDGSAMNTNHCGNDGDNKHCQSCNSSHCHYSALPVFSLAQTNLSNYGTPHRLLVSAPISRPENNLRPPIR
ncbi:hypothetical protein [Photobacterium lutimaris]|uniref:hypothetical protein n=1 Tax=Photobacterium lutimaris TaxID=388278 RepID=UPI0010612167|nr:hypothetical protein [Photobacterium lutimaris]